MGEIVNKPEYKNKKKPSKKGIEGEDEDGNDAYTKVQYVKVGGEDASKPGSDKEPEQYIKVSGPLLNKPTGGNEPAQYFKVNGDGDVNDVLDHLKTKGCNWNKPEDKKYEKVVGKDLDNVKDYFKKEDDKPAEYYYKTKVGGDKSDQGDNLGKIQSVTIKGDTENKLNPDKKIGDVFGSKKDKEKGTPTCYYCKVLGAGKNNPENIQLIPAKGDTNMDDVYNKIKTLGGISNNPNDDEGLQLIKVYGKADINEIGKHIKQAENVANKAAPKDKPEEYYFQNKIIGKNIGKPVETESLGKVDSITIKKPLESETNLGKDIETLELQLNLKN